MMTNAARDDLDNLTNELNLALKNWHIEGGTPESLMASLFIVQRERINRKAKDDPALLRLATSEVLSQAIDVLIRRNPEGARVIKHRFVEGRPIRKVANLMNISDNQVNRRQKKAIKELAEILQEMEAQGRRNEAERQKSLLEPPTYTRLFGIEAARRELLPRLQAQNAPWVMALVGIGGIGKTALADYLVRLLIDELVFSQVMWIRLEYGSMSGRSQGPKITFEKLMAELFSRLFPAETPLPTMEECVVAVRQALKADPVLIIIDNLEAEEDTAYLLNHLNELADPSKFLLTTRTRAARQAAVFDYSLNELAREDAYSLMRYHAQACGIELLAQATDGDLDKIYEKVGGNPLALKILVSLLDILPLPRLLGSLERNYPEQLEKMYTHIYWQAWQTLSENGRALLQAMPLVADSAEPDYLLTISGLPEAALWPAIEELRQRSLIEVRGTVHERKYGIHRLTETFLRTEIINLPVGD